MILALAQGIDHGGGPSESACGGRVTEIVPVGHLSVNIGGGNHHQLNRVRWREREAREQHEEWHSQNIRVDCGPAQCGGSPGGLAERGAVIYSFPRI